MQFSDHKGSNDQKDNGLEWYRKKDRDGGGFGNALVLKDLYEDQHQVKYWRDGSHNYVQLFAQFKFQLVKFLVAGPVAKELHP